MKNLERLIQRACENRKKEDRTSPQLDRKIIETASRHLPPAAQPQKSLGRTIMKSPITKVAAAAVILVGIVFFVTQPTSVAIAEVAEKVKQFDRLIQRERRIMTIVGQEKPAMVTEVKKYVLTNQGCVEEQYDQQGNLLTTVYLLKDKQQVISVLHPPKQYFVMDLKGTVLELPGSVDAQGLVGWIVLEQNPVKLGQTEINGRKAEGFEAVNPKAIVELSRLSNGMLPVGDNRWRLWIDVDSKLPVKIQAEYVMGKGPLTNNTEVSVKTETTGIEWGAQFDKSIFEPVIPADYALIGPSTPTK
jgi:hypothetical protein